MTIFDFVVLLILFLSIVISVMRGLVREVLSLASWVGAFLVAKYGAPVVAGWLPGLISHPNARLALGFVLVMVASVLLFSLLSLQFAKLVKITGLSGTDRALGAFFGLARGVLVAVLLVSHLTSHASAADGPAASLELLQRWRVAEQGQYVVRTRPRVWAAQRTAVIICDMWDYHHSYKVSILFHQP